MFKFTIEGGLGLSRQEENFFDNDFNKMADTRGFERVAGAPFSHCLTSSPALYPIAVDPRADAVQFIAMTQADYAAASFLDGRMLTPGVASAWCPWAEVRRAAVGLSERCHFIFHISHVGSTLLSRLLGHHPSLFSLREPAILRNLADIHLTLDQPACPWGRTEFDERLAVFLALWSRTFEREQTALIKATSFVSEMSKHLMERVANSRAIFMFVSPLTFLKALLDGAMSDIAGMAEKRLFRLQRRLGASYWRLQDLSAGECVAMSWLSEMFALHATAGHFPTRVLWTDFDRFLRAPEAGLVATLRHLGAGAADETAKAVLSGPTMSQYAKAPAHKFDAQLRDQLLRQGEDRHASEIRKGMDWLDRAAAIPAVLEVLKATASPQQPVS
jgi:hypothetical protein